jgi:hypothetical protein
MKVFIEVYIDNRSVSLSYNRKNFIVQVTDPDESLPRGRLLVDHPQDFFFGQIFVDLRVVDTPKLKDAGL